TDLGRDRREDGVEVADDGPGRATHDRRLRVRVDGEDRLRRPTADDVLDRPADAARDVEVGRDPGAGLPDLVPVRAPAGAGDHARDTDRPPQERRQLLERREALRSADTAATANDHLR